MRRSAELIAGAALAAVLAGCGNGESAPPPTTTAPTTGETTTAPAPTTTTAPAPTTTTTTTEPAPPPPGPPFGTAPVSAAAEGTGLALLTDVRLGRHEGFDRVVFEFRGGAPPGYRVRYVRPPIREDPSDLLLPVAGEAFLSVRMEPASGFDLAGELGETYTGPMRIAGAGAGTETLEEVVRAGDFEGVLIWVAGLESRAPFRVLRLTGPARLVVDVRSP